MLFEKGNAVRNACFVGSAVEKLKCWKYSFAAETQVKTEMSLEMQVVLLEMPLKSETWQEIQSSIIGDAVKIECLRIC